MIRTVQALRGVACLLVVLYHVGGWENMVWPRVRLLYPFRYCGYAGVDLFFVLSGLIIARGNWHRVGQPSAVVAFLRKRLWRVYPPFWAALVVTATLSAVVAKQEIAFGGFEWLTWASLAPTATGCKLLPVAWTLTYELMFYLAFAGLFLLPRRAAGFLPAGCASAVAVATVLEWQPTWFPLSLATSPYVLEFLAGALIGVRFPTPPRPYLLLALGIGWAVVAGSLLNTGTPDDLGGIIPARVLTFGPAAALVVAAAVGLEGRVTPPRWLVSLGDASYAIYLFHGTFCISALFLTWGIGHTFWPHLVWLAAMLGAGVGGGYLMHLLVERPLLRLGNRKRTERTTVVAYRVSIPVPAEAEPCRTA